MWDGRTSLFLDCGAAKSRRCLRWLKMAEDQHLESKQTQPAWTSGTPLIAVRSLVDRAYFGICLNVPPFPCLDPLAGASGIRRKPSMLLRDEPSAYQSSNGKASDVGGWLLLPFFSRRGGGFMRLLDAGDDEWRQ